ncbi:MAG: dephospho-CoA kinase [Paramuribaculum sp.]|nr:dephospho-CoA kinase [Paramuribaculum sp.]
MAADRLIAVCGGIGSGKSVVCRILRCMGYPVYDCDTRAKQLMDTSDGIRRTIAEEICAEAIDCHGRIDRSALAAAVFGDAAKLEILNRAVHGCVLTDLDCWQREQQGVAFVETAILYQSGLHRLVDEVWEVVAPEAIRVRRVKQRNGLSEAQVLERIEAQRYQPEAEDVHTCVREIVNDGSWALLPQIEGLLRKL